MFYYRARWYDPVVGRFIGEDPIGFAAGDTNISRYVANQVTVATDPSGLNVLTKPPTPKVNVDQIVGPLDVLMGVYSTMPNSSYNQSSTDFINALAQLTNAPPENLNVQINWITAKPKSGYVAQMAAAIALAKTNTDPSFYLFFGHTNVGGDAQDFADFMNAYSKGNPNTSTYIGIYGCQSSSYFNAVGGNYQFPKIKPTNMPVSFQQMQTQSCKMLPQSSTSSIKTCKTAASL